MKKRKFVQKVRFGRKIFLRHRDPKAFKRYAVLVGVFAVLIGLLIIERNTMNANYTGLLNTIAQGESKGNYNAYFGNAGNSEIRFTTMTVDEVLKWQSEYVAQGNPSSAVGRYQFIQPTLEGLLTEMHIERNAAFDEELQDKLATRLLERRGVREYLRGRISREQFAHNLSKEWAALPKVIGDNPSTSYYAGDGLNKALISVNDTLAAIDSLHEKN